VSTVTALPMKIKCCAPYAGGKRRLAPRIVELLGPHDTYVEPFVGGCSILPAKPRSDREYVYDLNADVIDVIRHLGAWATPEWIDYCARTLRAVPYGRESFDAARERLAVPNRDDDRPRAMRVADLLVVWWMGPGGIAGTDRKPWFAQRHTKTGGDPQRRWESFVESVPALCERLNGVCANVADGITALEQSAWMDRVGTAIYCDPPYFDKSFQYAADFGAGDHTRLAIALNDFVCARVVVSYRDDPDDPTRLARLYPPDKWRRIEVEQSKNMSASQGKTGRNVEVLLVNDAATTT
jgi:DNA adenine methylase